MCAESRGAAVTREFALQVRLAREAMGLSQRTLADQTGIDRSGIARIEMGERDPRLSEVATLVEALRIDISQLFPANAPARRPARDQRIETFLQQALELLQPQQGDL